MGENIPSATSKSGILAFKSTPLVNNLCTPPQPKFLIGNIKSIVQTQLTFETHQIWHSHIRKLFKDNWYEGYLTGETTCVNKILTFDEGDSVETPNYTM